MIAVSLSPSTCSLSFASTWEREEKEDVNNEGTMKVEDEDVDDNEDDGNSSDEVVLAVEEVGILSLL